MKTNERMNRGRSAGFTLIEILVVVVVIAILMGGVFKLVTIAAGAAKKAETIAILEKTRNAIGAFYAEYGCYPPVQHPESSDLKYKDDPTLTPPDVPTTVSFNYPLGEKAEKTAMTAIGKAPVSANGRDDEYSQMPIFKFGLMSFLVPRLGTIVNEGDPPQAGYIYWRQAEKGGWSQERGKTLSWLLLRNTEMADPRFDVLERWQPHIEGILSGHVWFWPSRENAKCVVARRTIWDAWEHDLMYYSAPPYRSYRLYSIGPNGKDENGKGDDIELTDR